MTKLNKGKIRWIVKHWELGELSHWQIAKQQNITKQYALRVFKRFKDAKRPTLSLPGRQPKPFTQEEIESVKETYNEYQFGAVNMEKVLNEKGIKISHNRIHKILALQGVAKEQPSKKKCRKWVRYERKHSNSLWHTDWFEWQNQSYILYEDDASRLITSYGCFKNATTDNAIKVFDEGTITWGKPKQVMSDHGTQFCANEEREYRYSNYLKENNVQHIKARVKHPQSNGKLERLVFTMKCLLKRFGNLETAVQFYNEKRPHMSLENDHLRTPIQAFVEKT